MSKLSKNKRLTWVPRDHWKNGENGGQFLLSGKMELERKICRHTKVDLNSQAREAIFLLLHLGIILSIIKLSIQQHGVLGLEILRIPLKP